VATKFPPWLTPRADGVMLDVLVAPRASRNRILGVHDERLKIQLTAPPVEGQANDALRRFIAEQLGVARAQVEIVGGAANKRKTVRLTGVAPHLVLLKLAPPQSD
jgi:uncharacterized protein